MIPAITEDQMRLVSLSAFNKIVKAVEQQKDLMIVGAIAQDAVVEMALEVDRIETETRKTLAWRFRNLRHQVFGSTELEVGDMTPNQQAAFYDAVDNEFGIKVDRRGRAYNWALLEDIQSLLGAK